MCVAANASRMFCMAYFANIEGFYIIITFHFKYKIPYASKLGSLNNCSSVGPGSVSGMPSLGVF